VPAGSVVGVEEDEVAQHLLGRQKALCRNTQLTGISRLHDAVEPSSENLHARNDRDRDLLGCPDTLNPLFDFSFP